MVTTDNTRESVLARVSAFYRGVMGRIISDQAGVATAFDTLLLSALKQIRDDHSAGRGETTAARDRLELFQRYSSYESGQRLVRYSSRAGETVSWRPFAWEPTPLQLAASQGVKRCITWKGQAIFKTVFDLAIYPMLISNLKPTTIVELGSGTGASALWFADLLRAHHITGRIYSIDVRKPELRDPQVVFIQGEGREIHTVCSLQFLESLSHPWLIIEDMHVNTIGVLRHFAPRMSLGDYIIIEDSLGKQSDLAAFDRESGSAFMIDTYYTDFFGRNATCSADSIFVKVSDNLAG